MKKKAAKSHHILVEVYGVHALAERTCQKWFARFKSGNFDLEDDERPGQPKKFEDHELETLLDQDPSQTQEELAKSLGVAQQTISDRLKAMGMIRKVGHWVPYELKPRDVERRFFACEQLLQRHKRKCFLHRLVTGDEKWVHYDNPKRRATYGYPGHASSSTAVQNIHGLKVMLCIWGSLQLKNTRRQLIRLSRALKEKRPETETRHDYVILQHDNARPHVAQVVKTYLETLKWDVLPHSPYSPDLAPSDYYLFRSMQHGLADQHFSNYEEVKNWIDSWIAEKPAEFFRKGIRELPEKWEKVIASDEQYFEY
ncbi:Ribonuclease H-like domain,Winged helix-turn-helix DNA-binding domain [Cinara cedri]|uniref:Ribonuclease H-like domain,Winged helix-turn-helix DNA-binding domain n=1 Tax=Cinara cedri TaxID=506608 RepID=A0A5E4MX05_9HEMI|nr:Ribonuclease H-like domain,Winged helix-turn-helix DNA-binding domain [Cinara cedri]